MLRIEQYEDEIQQTRFILAGLKIELAFTRIVTIADRKKIGLLASSFSQIRRVNCQNTVEHLYDSCDAIIDSIEQVRRRWMCKAFCAIKTSDLHWKALKKRELQNQENQKLGQPRRQMRSNTFVETNNICNVQDSENVEKEIEKTQQAIKKLESAFNKFLTSMKI